MTAPVEDIYIGLLRFGREKQDKPISFAEAQKHLECKGFDVNRERLKNLFFAAFSAQEDVTKSDEDKIKENTPHALKLDAYFQLLEHDKLLEARKDSRSSRYFAISAMLLSAILAIVSIVISSISLSNESGEVTLNDGQLSAILQEAESMRAEIGSREATQVTSTMEVPSSPDRGVVEINPTQISDVLQVLKDANTTTANVIETQVATLVDELRTQANR